jgi:hypothetical protein
LIQSALQGTFRKVTWRGIPVAVKKLDDDLIVDESKVWVVCIELFHLFMVYLGLILLNFTFLQKLYYPDSSDVLQAGVQRRA